MELLCALQPRARLLLVLELLYDGVVDGPELDPARGDPLAHDPGLVQHRVSLGPVLLKIIEYLK